MKPTPCFIKVERGPWTRFQDVRIAQTRPEAAFHPISFRHA